MKNEKGMGVITLILCVLLIIAVIILFFHFTKRTVTDNGLETIKTNMLKIQSKIKMIDGSVKMNAEENSFKGTKVSELKDDPEIKRMIENGVFGEEVDEYYRLGREELDEMDLNSIPLKENQYYFVHYGMKDVITNEDVKDKEGKVYHTLSELTEDYYSTPEEGE